MYIQSNPESKVGMFVVQKHRDSCRYVLTEQPREQGIGVCLYVQKHRDSCRYVLTEQLREQGRYVCTYRNTEIVAGMYLQSNSESKVRRCRCSLYILKCRDSCRHVTQRAREVSCRQVLLNICSNSEFSCR